MNEVHEDDDATLPMDVFENSMKELEKKNKEKYAFILKGGNDFKQALYKLFSLVWNLEEKPDQWRNTLIVQLFKGKGEKMNLEINATSIQNWKLRKCLDIW